MVPQESPASTPRQTLSDYFHFLRCSSRNVRAAAVPPCKYAARSALLQDLQYERFALLPYSNSERGKLKPQIEQALFARKVSSMVTSPSVCEEWKQRSIQALVEGMHW